MAGIYLLVFCMVYISNGVHSKKIECYRKVCEKSIDPFSIDEDEDPTSGNNNNNTKPGKMFEDISGDVNLRKTSELHDNGYYTSLCWIEITTITETKNGSKSASREYAITFETPSDIPDKYVTNKSKLIENNETIPYKIYERDTKKSEVVNFTIINKSDDLIISQNRKVLCGSGPIYTRDLTEWPHSDKKRIEIRVSPKRQNLIVTQCADINATAVVLDTTKFKTTSATTETKTHSSGTTPLPIKYNTTAHSHSNEDTEKTVTTDTTPKTPTKEQSHTSISITTTTPVTNDETTITKSNSTIEFTTRISTTPHIYTEIHNGSISFLKPDNQNKSVTITSSKIISESLSTKINYTGISETTTTEPIMLETKTTPLRTHSTENDILTTSSHSTDEEAKKASGLTNRITAQHTSKTIQSLPVFHTTSKHSSSSSTSTETKSTKPTRSSTPHSTNYTKSSTSPYTKPSKETTGRPINETSPVTTSEITEGSSTRRLIYHSTMETTALETKSPKSTTGSLTLQSTQHIKSTEGFTRSPSSHSEPFSKTMSSSTASHTTADHSLTTTAGTETKPSKPTTGSSTLISTEHTKSSSKSTGSSSHHTEPSNRTTASSPALQTTTKDSSIGSASTETKPSKLTTDSSTPHSTEHSKPLSGSTGSSSHYTEPSNKTTTSSPASQTTAKHSSTSAASTETKPLKPITDSSTPHSTKHTKSSSGSTGLSSYHTQPPNKTTTSSPASHTTVIHSSTSAASTETKPSKLIINSLTPHSTKHTKSTGGFTSLASRHTEPSFKMTSSSALYTTSKHSTKSISGSTGSSSLHAESSSKTPLSHASHTTAKHSSSSSSSTETKSTKSTKTSTSHYTDHSKSSSRSTSLTSHHTKPSKETTKGSTNSTSPIFTSKTTEESSTTRLISHSIMETITLKPKPPKLTAGSLTRHSTEHTKSTGFASLSHSHIEPSSKTTASSPALYTTAKHSSTSTAGTETKSSRSTSSLPTHSTEYTKTTDDSKSSDFHSTTVSKHFRHTTATKTLEHTTASSTNSTEYHTYPKTTKSTYSTTSSAVVPTVYANNKTVCNITRQKVLIKVKVIMEYIVEEDLEGETFIEIIPIAGIEKDTTFDVVPKEKYVPPSIYKLNKAWESFLDSLSYNFFYFNKNKVPVYDELLYKMLDLNKPDNDFNGEILPYEETFRRIQHIHYLFAWCANHTVKQIVNVDPGFILSKSPSMRNKFSVDNNSKEKLQYTKEFDYQDSVDSNFYRFFLGLPKYHADLRNSSKQTELIEKGNGNIIKNTHRILKSTNDPTNIVEDRGDNHRQLSLPGLYAISELTGEEYLPTTIYPDVANSDLDIEVPKMYNFRQPSLFNFKNLLHLAHNKENPEIVVKPSRVNDKKSESSIAKNTNLLKRRNQEELQQQFPTPVRGFEPLVNKEESSTYNKLTNLKNILDSLINNVSLILQKLTSR